MQDLAPALFFIAVLAFIWGLKYLQVRRGEREREMIHRERLVAMEKGIPLPELPAVPENGQIVVPLNRNTLPRLMLGCGLILVTGAFGILTSFLISPISEVHRAWTLGYIPLLIGIGCLIYALLLFRMGRSNR